jgi:hypothetical protein
MPSQGEHTQEHSLPICPSFHVRQDTGNLARVENEKTESEKYQTRTPEPHQMYVVRYKLRSRKCSLEAMTDMKGLNTTGPSEVEICRRNSRSPDKSKTKISR